MIPDKMVLGENAVYSTDSRKTGLNNNVIVCGSTGCGKTVSIAEPLLLETHNSSLIVTVTKRRLVNKYKPLFKSRGYTVKDMNFISPTDSDIAFDPLKYITSYQDIAFLAESIVLSNPKKRSANSADPYWDQAAISLLSAEIAYILMTKQDGRLSDVLSLHDSIDYKESEGQLVTSLDAKFKRIEERGPNFATSCWKSFHQLPIKTAACVFGTLNASIATIFNPELRAMIATKETLDFERLASEKTVLFISSSAVNTALHCFINMIYAQAFKSLFEFAESLPESVLPIPVHVLCDDFATGSPILMFPEYISIFREKRISATILIQSESQLENMYGSDNATTILNNADTYVYMGGMDLRTCRSISERLNAPLEDVLSMPIGQEYIFRRGQKPIVTQRYNVLQDRLYQMVTQEYDNDIKKQARER